MSEPQAPGPDPRALGLAAERTALAWQRTALGLAGVSALVLHDADGVALAAPGVAGLALAVAMVLVGQRRVRTAVAAVRADRACAVPRALLAVALGTTAVAVAVAVAAIDLG